MDWQQNRLVIGGVLLVALGGLAIWAVQARTGDTPSREQDGAADFPDITREQIASLEITRPAEEGEDGPTTVRLEQVEGTWRVAQPMEAPADSSAVSTALDKLDELEITGTASRNPQFHERLEVDPEHGIHVIARNAENATIADLWIGAYSSGSTMIRREGEDRVVRARGSIKFAFNKPLRDWRDRTMLDLTADDVRAVSWVGPNGTFEFTRPEVAREAEEGAAEGEAAPSGTELGDWQIARVSYLPQTPDGGVPATAPLASIEDFAPTKVRSMVASLARMRASDFAASDVTPEAAGLGDSAARVALTVREGSEDRTHVVRLGNESNAERHEFYAQREGDPTIFVISRFLSERVHPTSTSFVQTAAPPPAAPGGPEGMPMPGGDPHGGAGQQLPPEVMEQLRRQLEAQGVHGGADP